MKEINKKFQKNSREEKGITLVALVITIVILIILSTIAIQFVFGDSGLINRTEQAKYDHNKANAREQIEIALADIAIIKYKPNTEYSDEKLDDLIYERLPESDVNGDEISYGGHTFELDRSVPKLGEWLEESGNLPARIKKIELIEDTSQSQITVQVETVRIEKVENPKYKYYIKEEGQEDSSYVEKANIAESTYTFTGLENKNYVIKVELISESTSTVVDYKETTVLLEEKFSEIYQETTEYTDSDGNKAWIPRGFAVGVSGGINKINDGLVITDKIDENNYSIGNQFVWIPVNDTSLNQMYKVANATLNGVTTTTNVYSKLRQRSGDSYTDVAPGTTSGIKEPDVLISTIYGDAVTGDSTKGIEQIKSVLGISGSTNSEVLKNYAQGLVDEYKATYESIKKYDGFYIGRFELTGSVETPTVQKEQEILVNKNWYNLKKACTNVISNSYVQSTMVYGNQWDEIMSWLISTGEKTESEVNKDSSSWGNYSTSTGNAATNSGSKQTSGKNEACKANNIYDLAGNCYEWTQEASNTDLRVDRGGTYFVSGSDYSASCRKIQRS